MSDSYQQVLVETRAQWRQWLMDRWDALDEVESLTEPADLALGRLPPGRSGGESWNGSPTPGPAPPATLGSRQMPRPRSTPTTTCTSIS